MPFVVDKISPRVSSRQTSSGFPQSTSFYHSRATFTPTSLHAQSLTPFAQQPICWQAGSCASSGFLIATSPDARFHAQPRREVSRSRRRCFVIVTFYASRRIADSLIFSSDYDESPRCRRFTARRITSLRRVFRAMNISRARALSSRASHHHAAAATIAVGFLLVVSRRFIAEGHRRQQSCRRGRACAAATTLFRFKALLIFDCSSLLIARYRQIFVRFSCRL